MALFAIGVYWHSRNSTLREFSNNVRGFLGNIKKIGPDLHEIQWTGNKSNPAILLTDNFSNLDDIVLKYSHDSETIYQFLDKRSCPTWDSFGSFGFSMSFNNGKTARKGGIEINISAGITESDISNAVTITFPFPEKLSDKYYHQQEFQKNQLCEMIKYWQPDFGRVIHTEFDKIVSDGSFTDIGWLTYIKNSNASAMRNNPDLIAAGIEMEPVSIGGTLFSIDREMVSPDNEVQVARAKLLRTKLMENHLIDS